MDEKLFDFDTTIGEAKSYLEEFARSRSLDKNGKDHLLKLFFNITKRQLPWINWDNIRQNTQFKVRY
jgi:hypothetical protein